VSCRMRSSLAALLVAVAFSNVFHACAYTPGLLSSLSSPRAPSFRPMCGRRLERVGMQRISRAITSGTKMVAVEPEKAVASSVALVSLGCPKNVVDAEVILPHGSHS